MFVKIIKVLVDSLVRIFKVHTNIAAYYVWVYRYMAGMVLWFISNSWYQLPGHVVMVSRSGIQRVEYNERLTDVLFSMKSVSNTLPVFIGHLCIIRSCNNF